MPSWTFGTRFFFKTDVHREKSKQSKRDGKIGYSIIKKQILKAVACFSLISKGIEKVT